MYTAQLETHQSTKSYDNLWAQLLEQLRVEYGDAISRSWFSHLKFEEIKEGIMVITVPTRFIKEWIMNNYFCSIQEITTKLDYTINKIDIRARAQRILTPSKVVNNDNYALTHDAQYKCSIFDYVIDPRFTFENFIVGTSNKVAYTITKSVAENNATISNNIVFIQSNVGMGKTHLLQSISAYIRVNNPKRKVAYLSAEKFMYLYIKSVRDNDLITFKEKLRTADILLIDDLQFICGKNSTEQELLNTVIALTESNKKVVVSCDTTPYNLNLDVRAKSRLIGGLVVTIDNPEYELCLEILKSKVKQLNVVIADEIIELIASNIKSNVRELEGALNKLISYCSIAGKDISRETAHDILRENIAAHNQQVSINDILKYVGEFYGTKIEDIKSKKRSARLVLARQISAFVAKQLTQNSLQEIGHQLGDKDHATIIYSIKKIEEKMTYDKNLSQSVSKIISALGNKDF